MRIIPLALCTALLCASPLAGAFELASQDIKPGAMLSANQVFKGFGCEGNNISPQLSWHNPPAGTKSYAVTVYDPDAPTGSGWWHWVVWNIPAEVAELRAGIGNQHSQPAFRLPEGAIEGRTDFGSPGFGGACPPKGDKPHRYIFTVHALKVDKLDLPENPTAALVGFMLNANRLGKASITAKYGR